MDVSEEKLAANFLCKDCGVDTKSTGEYYMVHNHIWIEAGMSLEWFSGMLCIADLERRLDRRLTVADFTAYPVNERFFEKFGVDRFL